MNGSLTKAAAQGYLRNTACFVSFVTIFLVCSMSFAAPQPLINYFKPIPIVSKLSTTTWGASAVGPIDTCNGIEDPANYRYWDGKIIKGSDGKYHLFCSRWPASAGLDGWMTVSVSVHAVSDSILGPYKYQNQTYTYQNGKGHNTTGLTLLNGTYVVVESAIVPGWIFTSSSLSGSFNYLGSIIWNGNGFNPTNVTSNLQIMIGPDNRYWAIGSSGFVLNSDSLLGTYTCRTASIYPTIPGMNSNTSEDPIIWYSGGYYHVVYNYWDARKAYHLMSKDGINNWINTGVALDRSTNFIRYTDGTVNHWGNMERPNVYMENGHVTYFTFAVTDKDKDSSNASTGSKVIVVPFDGVSFDADNGGTAVIGGAGGRYMDAGNRNRVTYNLSGRAVGHKNLAKSGIYLVQKADGNGVQKVFIAK
ncbi:MAG: glycoside hydrolase family protein [Chitinispirillaceae bacterium]|jgi:hypothetical protein